MRIFPALHLLLLLLRLLQLGLLLSSGLASAAPERGETELPPTRSATPNPLEWVQVSLEDLAPSTTAKPSVTKELPVVSARLQFWLDAVDAHLRAAYQLPADVPPRPLVHLVNAASANASVTGVTLCLHVHIAGRSSPNAEALFITLGAHNRIAAYPRAHVACLDRRSEEQDGANAARYLQERLTAPGCVVTAAPDGLEFSDACPLPEAVRQGGAAGLMYTATADHVTVHTGLLHVYPDEALLTVALSHELGHYYRAHAAIDRSAYSVFYRDDEANRRLAKPLGDSASQALGQLLRKLPSVHPAAVRGQRFHSALLAYTQLALNKLVLPSCPAGTSCAQSCAELVSLWPTLKAPFATFPQAALPTSAEALYTHYEEALATCFAAIDVPGTLSFAALKSVYWQATPAPSLLAGVESMQRVLAAQDQREATLMREALDKQLGYYTIEQEADNLSLAWLPAIGIAPEVAVRHWFTFAARAAARRLEQPFSLPYARCLELYQAVPRWHERGLQRLIPIGLFSDLHHSNCYRIYNLDQQRAAHPRSIGADLMGQAQQLGGAWEDIQRQLPPNLYQDADGVFDDAFGNAERHFTQIGHAPVN